MTRNVTCRVGFYEKSFAQVYKLAQVCYSVLFGDFCTHRQYDRFLKGVIRPSELSLAKMKLSYFLIGYN